VRLQPSGIFLIAAVLFFYVRLIWLQKAKITLAKQAAVQANDADKSQHRKPKKEKSYFDKYRFRIINWYLLIGAVVIIAAGAIISTSNLLGETARSLWWIPTVGGIFILSFSFA
jgi:sterol desaturase/sphingolipid hydroxylase (fatty acid hydroxylase superfamily)